MPSPVPSPPPPEHSADELQREKLSVIGYMAISTAHELSNPLATISAGAQALLASLTVQAGGDGMGEVSGQELREELALIAGEAKRAAEIVGSLLLLVRQHPPARQRVALPDVIRRVARVSRHHLAFYRIDLVVPSPTEPGAECPAWAWVEGDANQLQQVLLNLVVNAQHAIKASGGAGEVRIHLAQADAGRVAITVEDDGPGIPAALRERVFERFFTTKRAGQGTGLGLAITRDIVTHHGGEIRVEDRPGCGARFVVVLPSLAPVAESAAPPPERARRTVLVVDDEPGIRRALGRLLRHHGYEVTAVETAEEAVPLLADQALGVVVCDVRLPGMSGIELLSRVRASAPELASRFLFASGAALSEDARSRVREAGAQLIQKPYDVEQLLTMIRAISERPRAAASRPTALRKVV